MTVTRKAHRGTAIRRSAACGLALVLVTGLTAGHAGAATRSGPAAASGTLHKIRASSARLYDGVTGKAFTPRGSDFVRLAQAADGSVYHSTFEPGQYDPADVQAVLNGMKQSGYNTVRIFIDPGEFTSPSHGISTGVTSMKPLKAAYMDNVADFIKRAAGDGIYTVPVLSDIPANQYFYRIAGSPKGNIRGNNVLYLDRRYVRAKELYMRLFTRAIVRLLGAQHESDILAYESDNEVYFDASQAPFDTMSGKLTSLNGITYNMAKPAQRQKAADANLAAYSRDMKQALTQADPKALLMMGFFTNLAVGKTGFNGLRTHCSAACDPGVDYRVPGRASAVSANGKTDILDIHVYQTGRSYSLQNDLNSIEYSKFTRPYILGEFGVTRAAFDNNITDAAFAMKDLQTGSCPLHAKGWLFWTWDTDTTTSLASQGLFYSLADDSGAINGQLAPIVRPSPCG